MSTLLLSKVRRWVQMACGGMAATALFSGAAVADGIPGYLVYPPPPVFPGATPPGETAQIKGSELWSVDSNPLRLTQGEKSLTGSNTIADLILGNNTPTSELSLDSQVNQGLFNNSAFNSTDNHETLDMFKATQLWSIGAEGHFDYDTTRTSELYNNNTTTPDIRHTGLSIAPQISYSPSILDKISLNAYADHSVYDNSAFTDYNFYSVSPSYSHNFDPMNAGLLIWNMQRYESEEGPKLTVDSIGPSLGWTSIITQKLTTRLTGGIEEATQNQQGAIPASQSRLNYVFSGNATFKGQQDTSSFVMSRVETPFGNGGSSLLTSFIVNEAHNVNEKITLNAGADYRFANYATAGAITLDKEMAANAGISYHLLDNLDATGSYRYLDQTLNGETGSVKEQVFMIGLSFHPAARSLN